MDIRQLVIVALKRDEIVEKLCNLFEIKVAYYDPGIIHFGLENALLPIGNTFLEVISPVEDNTTAGRFLDRRGGDGGYMVIIQVDDFNFSKKAVQNASIDIVFESEDPNARAIHLHPKQLGGAILSLDSMDPPESWKWAGDNWKEKVNTTLVESIAGVQVQSSDPLEMKRKWQLEQKRRWLVESRLGRGRGGPLENGGGHPSMSHNPRYYGGTGQVKIYFTLFILQTLCQN